MEKSNKEANLKNNKSRWVIFTVLIVVFAAVGGFALYNLIPLHMEYHAAQKEYSALRQFAPVLPDEHDDEQTSNAYEQMGRDLLRINPDYVGWLFIEGTRINYPVVQGTDNYMYLDTTFQQQRNASGTIFMDYRNSDDFSGFVMLHGHNMRDGSMFADLFNYRSAEFLESYPEIIVIPLSGDALHYRIFDVRYTDIDDITYSLAGKDDKSVYEHFALYGVREDANIIALSTCARGHREGRLLILAATP